MNSKILSFTRKSNLDTAIIIIKISIIFFFSIFFIANFQAFFLGQDAYLYGLGSIGISEGTFEKTNSFLEETGRYEFIPRQWIVTESNTIIPSTSVGIMVMGSIAYSVFGYYGLFYLGPISSIILLIFSERIATKLFGSVAGLTALILVSTNLFIVRTGTDLLTGNISTIFLLIGFFYLLKFFQNPSKYCALIISSSLVVSTLIRASNSFYLPIEFLLIFGFFTIKFFQNKDKQHLPSYRISKKSLQIFVFLLLPWILFFVFQFSYNDYYFGDPTTTYVDVRYKIDSSIPAKNTDLGSMFNSENNIVKKTTILSQYLLPFPFSGAKSFETSYQDILGSNWLGIIPLIFLGSVLLISFFKKINYTELIVILAFSSGIILFYSSVIDTLDPAKGVLGRYMIPSFVFVSFFYGFVIQKISSTNLFNFKINLTQTLAVSFLIIFFFFALSYLSPVNDWMMSQSKFNNPFVYAERYPLDKEGLTQSSIILNTMGNWAVDYGVTPFHPFYGYSIKGNIDESKFPQEPIKLLKTILETNNDVYTFKKSSHVIEKRYFGYLETEHDLILKDYSKTFCKFEFKKPNTSSDEACLKD